MKEFIKKNFVIILAFLLPIVFIVAIALNAFIPSLLVSTDYDFVYATCSDEFRYNSGCDNFLKRRYLVIDGVLMLKEIPIIPGQDSDGNKIPNVSENYQTRIFLHNAKKNESREITFNEAKNLNLRDLLTSPDGITISNSFDRNYGGDFFFFGGGRSSYGYYMTKGSAKKKLNLINVDDGYRSNNFKFIGWVL